MKRTFAKYSVLAGAIALFLLVFPAASGQIKINEISASNAIQAADPDYQEYSDWLELYNAGPAAENLQGYYLTDNFSIPNKWHILEEVTIDPGGFLLIWADGRDSGLHTNFRLSADGEEIAIYTPNLSLVDSLSYSYQKTDISYGRIADGHSDWGYFQEATPGASNSTPSFTEFTSSLPEFSMRGGFYSAPLSVELHTDASGEIRYTTDGSVPDENAALYTAAIPVANTTILRARIFKPGTIPGPPVTQSYFMNENSVEGKLPVVSIATDPENFWDPEIGIYVQDFKPSWDVPINIELFENNGSDRAAFNELAGTKINGLNSWQLPQKMLGIYFKKQYGSSNLDYPILSQRTRSSYKSFALRASGSDWSYTLFRDMLGQHATLLNMDVDIMGFRPAVVFVNGEYMGIHNIREKVDDDYIEKGNNMAPGSFDLVENEDYPEAGDLAQYNHLRTLLSQDLSIDANYNAVAELVDIENLTDFVITEMAVRNWSISHNVMAWKPKEDGKWKWVLMDVDRGFFSASSSSYLIDWYMQQEELIFGELMANESYKSYFSGRLAAQLYTSFNPGRMKKLIEGHMQDIEAEIPRHLSRWEGATSSYGSAIPSEAKWRENIESVKNFVEQRPAVLLNDLLLNDALNAGFTGIANLSLETLPEKAGTITLDGLIVPESFISGPYPKDLTFELVANEKPGYQFVGWQKPAQRTIIPKESEWKYYDLGTDLGSGWTDSSYNDGGWNTGIAQLGYGDGDENTLIGYGPVNDKYITSYFRRSFTISEAEKNGGQFNIELLRDDGAVVYINGTEVIRSNMNAGEINHLTLSATTCNGEEETTYYSYPLDGESLKIGQNILAVEVHQANGTSSDVSFDLKLSVTLPEINSIVSTSKSYSVSLNDDLYLIASYNKVNNCLVPEIVSGDLTLGIGCSPYFAQGDIHVTENATLTIEPGVEIWMPEGANILVNGTVKAIGTSSSGIKIKLNPEYEGGSWGVISFQNTPEPSELKYLSIEDASTGPDPVLDIAAISAFHADLVLDHLTLENNSGNPIVARYSDIRLSNSRLHSEITGDLINVKYGKALVENCRFRGNDQPDTDAIDYDEIENGIIRNCEISGFYGFNSDAIDIGEEATNVLIDSVYVYNITDKGVSVGQRSTVTVKNSIFVNCNMGIALKDSSRARIDHCVFYSNAYAVACFEKNPGHFGGNASISNSILSNVSGAPTFVDSKSDLEISYSLSDSLIVAGAPSNLQGNPLFSNPGYFDFELQPGSPAIMTGSDNGTPVNLGSYNNALHFEPSVLIYQMFINAGGLYIPEFITLFNPSSEKADLSNYAFTKGITMTIPEGTILNPGDRLYLTDRASADMWNGQNRQVIQWLSGKLSNEGEAIQLEDSHGIVIDYLKYNINSEWPAGGFTADGLFQLIHPGLDNHFPENWTVESMGQTVNISKSESRNMLSIYPNPTRDMITIDAPDYKNQSIEIYNLTGQLLGREALNESGEAAVDLSAYNSGILLIKVGEQIKKVVVVK